MKTNMCMLCALLCLSLWLCTAGTVSAEEVYTVTEPELQLLETNLAKLKVINSQQLQQIKEQKNLINQAKLDLMEQAKTLTECRLELSQAQNSLENANRLLAEYEKEAKSKLRKTKRQRTIYVVIAASLGFCLVRKAHG